MIKRLFVVIAAVLFVLIGSHPACCGSDASDSQDQIGWDIFGSKGGWVHAHLTVEQEYSDNIYYTDTNEESDYITLIRPGIWFSIPGSKKKTRTISTTKDTPGGISISRYDQPCFRPFNAYFSYEPEFELYADNSDQNTTSHELEGALRYNLKGGLSIEVLDQFVDTYDSYSTSLSDIEEQDKYQTNLVNITLEYRISEKLNVKLDYSNFLVDYDEAENKEFNRTDHTGAGYIFFQVRPKAAVFTGYEVTEVDYDKDENSDSTENRFYGGFQWDITDKSRGRIKAGYGITDFDDSNIDDAKDYIYEIQVNHHFTRKTSLSVFAYRKKEEADFSIYDYILSHRAGAAYLQRVTRKISLGMRISYANENYESESGLIGGSEEREDDVYYVAPSIRYHFRDWLSMSLEYMYEKRDSNIPLDDFEANSVSIGFTLEI